MMDVYPKRSPGSLVTDFIYVGVVLGSVLVSENKISKQFK